MNAKAGVAALKQKLLEQPKDAPKQVVISPPKFQRATAKIKGDAPLLSNAMSSEARAKMKAGQESGTRVRKMRKVRDPKDFNAAFKGSLHVSKDGWFGLPCSSFRNAMIDACRTVDMPMARAKLVLFVEADGFDANDGTPLVRIHGTPVMDERIGKLASGTSDILVRGRFDEWSANVKLKWDSDSLGASDVFNLLARAGWHCGVGAGRPNSKNSAGIGMGTFVVIGQGDKQ
jgi:hypothetical protein